MTDGPSSDGPDDIELLQQWRAGDREAGSTIYKRYCKPVAAYFRTKVPEALEDLMSETFLAMVESRDRFRHESSFKTYLFRIARNVYANYVRKHLKRGFDPAADSIADVSGRRQSSVMVEGEQLRCLLEALRSVSIDDQDLLELYYFEELTAKQIAAIFDGLPEGTVRSRVRAALERLAARYGEIAKRPSDREADDVDVFEEWLGVLRREVRGFGPATAEQQA